jgi:hypothetical protein
MKKLKKSKFCDFRSQKILIFYWHWLNYYLLVGMFMDKVKNFCDHCITLRETTDNLLTTGHFWTTPASFRVKKLLELPFLSKSPSAVTSLFMKLKYLCPKTSWIENVHVCQKNYWAERYHTSLNSFNKGTKISSLEIDIFDLKMMMKSGLEFFVLKLTEPLQGCCCPVQKNLPRKAELAWQVSRYL